MNEKLGALSTTNEIPSTPIFSSAQLSVEVCSISAEHLQAWKPFSQALLTNPSSISSLARRFLYRPFPSVLPRKWWDLSRGG